MKRDTEVQAEIKNKNLVLTIPLNAPRPSSTGKTLLVATTKGSQRTTLELEGNRVYVVANAFFYPKE